MKFGTPASAPSAPGAQLTLLREEPGKLGRGLTEAGVEVTHVPVTTTTPLPVSPDDVRGASLLALSSPRTLAVVPTEALDELRGVPTIAVGPVTAAAAREAGLNVVEVGDNDAHVMVELAPPPSTAGSVAIALGSAKARPTLSEGLTAKGWRVRVVPAYDTLPNPETADAVRATPPGALLVATASSQVDAWFTLGGRADVRWIVIGEPTAATLRLHDALPVLMPDHPSDLLATITQNLEELR